MQPRAARHTRSERAAPKALSEKEMPAPRGLLTRRPRQRSRRRWRTRSVCVAAIRVDGLWPGWGADPQGIKPAVLSVQVFCVGVSALPESTAESPGDEETRRVSAEEVSPTCRWSDVRLVVDGAD